MSQCIANVNVPVIHDMAHYTARTEIIAENVLKKSLKYVPRKLCIGA